MGLFALEYFRQFSNADLTHFHGKNKKAQLKIRHQLGPFVFNKREEAWKDADNMLGQELMLKQSFYWAPYDPEHFISLRRIKHRLSGYVHQPIPHIEQYANQREWVEGTLDDEELTEEEKLERDMKEIEKRIDLDYVAQVTFTQPQPVGASTSTATSRQPAKEAISSKAKGK